jgi:hypothetical protein
MRSSLKKTRYNNIFHIVNTDSGKKFMKWLRDEIRALETRYMRGMTAGEQRGLVIGEERGAEKQQSEMAQKMEAEGFDRETIQRITGLDSW